MAKYFPSEIEKLLKVKCFVESKTSNITSEWARNSEWDERMVSRDLFQNFFDGAKVNQIDINDIKDIELDQTCGYYLDGVTFDMRRLFYLGSEKSGLETVGQVGEGFKLAAVTLLRQFRVRVIAASGNLALEIRLAAKQIDDTLKMVPMEYDFYELENSINGNYLFIANPTQLIKDAMKNARYEFYYDGHPAMGRKLQISSWQDVLVYERSDVAFGQYQDTKSGILFYHNQLRATLPNANIVMVVNKRWKSIDNKIGQDRDRTMFGEKLKSSLLKLAVKHCNVSPREAALRSVLDISRHALPKGNVFLNILSDHIGLDEFQLNRLSDVAKQNYLTSLNTLRDEYLGKVYGTVNHQSKEIFDAINELEAKGYTPVPQYMQAYGAVSIRRYIARVQAEAANEVYNSGARQPTHREMTAINLCLGMASAIANKIKFNFHIFKSTHLMGQFKDKHSSRRNWNDKVYDIYLAEDVFVGQPGDLVSTVLHECSHNSGHDGSRGFTDALTEIIGNLIDANSQVSEAIDQLREVIGTIRQERNSQDSKSEEVHAMLARRDADEMAEILSKVPMDVISRLV